MTLVILLPSKNLPSLSLIFIAFSPSQTKVFCLCQ
jgi:hypothetical protein